MTVDNTSASNDDLRQVLNQIVNLAKQARALLQADAHTGVKMSARDAARVAKVGKIAHVHWQAIEDKGKLTLAESRQLRSDHSGAKMRSTANLFGRSDSNALLYRAVPYGSPQKGDQEVRLTAEGKRIAELYRAVHGLDDAAEGQSSTAP